MQSPLRVPAKSHSMGLKDQWCIFRRSGSTRIPSIEWMLRFLEKRVVCSNLMVPGRTWSTPDAWGSSQDSSTRKYSRLCKSHKRTWIAEPLVKRYTYYEVLRKIFVDNHLFSVVCYLLTSSTFQTWSAESLSALSMLWGFMLYFEKQRYILPMTHKKLLEISNWLHWSLNNQYLNISLKDIDRWSWASAARYCSTEIRHLK